MPEPIPTRYRVPAWDLFQYFATAISDRQVRCVVSFAGRVDADRLGRAVRLAVDAMPIAGCRYVPGWWQPHYERLPEIAQDQVFSYQESPATEPALSRFALQVMSPEEGPLARAALIRAGTDTFCLSMHHIVGDGAGLKEYVYGIAETYRRLAQEPSYRPTPNVRGSRSLCQVSRGLSLRDHWKALSRPDGLSSAAYDLRSPLRAGGDEPIMLRCTLEPGRVDTVKAYGKQYGATVNDVLLAAFYRALKELVHPQPGTRFAVPILVDLRRYLRNGEAEAIANLAHFASSDIGTELGDKFEQTLVRVRNDMNAKKADLPGLGGMPMYIALFKLLPYGVVTALVEHFVKRVASTEGEKSGAAPNIDNLGVLREERVSFGDVVVQNAFVTTPVTHPPTFQLAVSSFRGLLNMVVMTYRVVENMQWIERLFAQMDAELPR